jgi:hypothetical protein
MQVSASEGYVQQIADLARGLPEGKLRKVLAFVRRVKEEPQRPTTPLTPHEVIVLATERAAELRRQSRPLVEAQYQILLQALLAESEAKGIEVADFPRGD